MKLERDNNGVRPENIPQQPYHSWENRVLTERPFGLRQTKTMQWKLPQNQ
jgi:hypothetical protein